MTKQALSLALTLCAIAPIVKAQTMTAVVSSSEITLSWTPVAGATYSLLRCTGAQCSDFAPLATPTAGSYSDTTVQPGTSYVYQLIPTGPAVTLGITTPASSTSAFYADGAIANYTDPSGNVWVPDTSICPGGTLYSTTHVIANTTTQVLYQHERYGATMTCTIRISPGTYTLTGKFSENYWTAAGKRKFTATVNGAAWLTNFDIFASAGAEYTANDQSMTVTVPSSGAVVISCVASIDNCKFDGIELVPSTAATHSVTLGWTASASPSIAGYTVYRGTTAGGPYTALTSSILNQLSYVDSTVTGGATYYYVATATNASGQVSAYSNQATAVVP